METKTIDLNSPNVNQTPAPKYEARVMSDSEMMGVTAPIQKKRIVFDKLTEAHVEDISFVENEKKKASKSSDNETRVSIRIKMKLNAPIDGESEFFTNYGVAIYEKTEGVAIGSKNLSWGKTTDASSLRDMVSDASGIPKEQMDLLKLKGYLLGKTVYVKSESRPNPKNGEQVMKALIKQIKIG